MKKTILDLSIIALSIAMMIGLLWFNLFTMTTAVMMIFRAAFVMWVIAVWADIFISFRSKHKYAN